MVDPVLVGGAAAVAGVAIAAAYAYLSGDDAEAGVDVDGDGEDDVSYTFEGNDSADESTFGIGGGSGGEPTAESASEDVQDIGTDPVEVTGIGPTRADDLKKAGFHNASDLYFASDEELTGVSGIGDLTVRQISTLRTTSRWTRTRTRSTSSGTSRERKTTTSRRRPTIFYTRSA